jgi:hypothetical protein
MPKRILQWEKKEGKGEKRLWHFSGWRKMSKQNKEIEKNEEHARLESLVFLFGFCFVCEHCIFG